MVYNYTTKIALHFSLKNVSSIWPYNSFFSFVLFSSVVLVIIVYGPRFLEVKVGRFFYCIMQADPLQKPFV